MHQLIEPAILYFGTPVVLISTVNEDGTMNVAPMSSAWCLAWSCMIGLDSSSQTTRNLMRTGECVLNLVAGHQSEMVNRLAKTTGRAAVPLHKKALSYRHVADKLSAAELGTVESVHMAAPRPEQCALQLEAVVESCRPFGQNGQKNSVSTVVFELEIRAVHAHESIVHESDSDRIDPDAWKPLIMNFREFYSTGERVDASVLARGSEAQYAPWKLMGVSGAAKRMALSLANRSDRRAVRKASDV